MTMDIRPENLVLESGILALKSCKS